MIREKVMAGLECLTRDDFAAYATECWKRDCPYRNTDCEIAVMEDALALLKAQEPVKPMTGLWDRDIQLFNCGACGGEIGAGGIAKYCFHCGRAVKWE